MEFEASDILITHTCRSKVVPQNYIPNGKNSLGILSFKRKLEDFFINKIYHPANVKTSSYTVDITKMQNHLDTLLAYYTSNNKLDDVICDYNNLTRLIRAQHPHRSIFLSLLRQNVK